MICVFLGAGFSRVAGVPLASELFNVVPEVDRITRQRLIGQVTTLWHSWQSDNGGTPEEFLAYLQQQDGQNWLRAVWFVSLVIALKMGRLEPVGGKPTITRHNLNRTTGSPILEDFWSSIFKHTGDIAVITTNYDILPERGLRHMPRPRALRPGFHYGAGTEQLAGGGYPSYTHIQRISASGQVPLYKLHGSISWSIRDGSIKKYHDCRPAIRGDAAIVAPITTKIIPTYLRPIWQQAGIALSSSKTWIIVGYSLPEYDKAVRSLLVENAKHSPIIHVFDPDGRVALKIDQLLPRASIYDHKGLPEALGEIESTVMSKI